MSIIGSQWKDEPSDEEKFNDITGDTRTGRSDKELEKDIEKAKENGSRTERQKLGDLQQEINYRNER
jgi:hypothetical protein